MVILEVTQVGVAIDHLHCHTFCYIFGYFFVAVAMLVHQKMKAGSYFNKVCIFATYTYIKSYCKPCKNIHSYVHAQRSEKHFLSITAIHFGAPTWRSPGHL